MAFPYSGLISYWKLDESSGNAVDSVGSNTLTNNNSVTYGAALINNGANFGTSNTNKSLSKGSIITPLTSVSIQCWVKVNTLIPSGTTYGLFEQEDDTNAVIMGVLYDENSGSPRIRADYHKNNVSDNYVYYTTTMTTSVWHHIVITYDGSTFTLYFDGVSRGTPLTISGGGSGSVSGNEFTIGEMPRFGSFASMISDESGIWNRALTSGEVTTLYNGGAGLAYTVPSNGGGFLSFM